MNHYEHTITFPAPGLPASANVVNKAHWQKSRRLLAPWKDAAWGAWLAEPRAVREAWNGSPATVTVTLPFPNTRRRDPHNYVSTNVKAVIDGLVLAKLWPDDTPEWVRVAEPTLAVDPNSLVVVKIERRN